jgi:hypothetical protein
MALGKTSYESESQMLKACLSTEDFEAGKQGYVRIADGPCDGKRQASTLSLVDGKHVAIPLSYFLIGFLGRLVPLHTEQMLESRFFDAPAVFILACACCIHTTW